VQKHDEKTVENKNIQNDLLAKLEKDIEKKNMEN
jgi:hypothetical protein